MGVVESPVHFISKKNILTDIFFNLENKTK